MCRWAAYLGAPIFLSEILTAPAHSLIKQSKAATECKTAINADGFGLAWYDQRPEPGLYRDVYPAWSDPNLAALADQVKSPLFLAHVRASTGTATSRNNCHPFVQGRWSFMHNGQVGGFEGFRKSADMLIADRFYSDRRGATDSEAIFLTACGLGLEENPRLALEKAVGMLQDLAAQSEFDGALIRCTAALSDGETLYAIRYASDHLAPSLYYQWHEARRGWAVVSEPYEEDANEWHAVPAGSFCRFTRDTVEISSFEPNVTAQAA
ncbi:class II glutamine amidotransferase [Roseobacter sp. EG26]|uniref:class II glutamine amidotransferase n=1 Tax=Roseobacter sp. EG26 TaxID=3412477 RepID=UPI002625814B|nr:class II glutamine amidotransferase [uncultured Roseobacter sp.]